MTTTKLLLYVLKMATVFVIGSSGIDTDRLSHQQDKAMQIALVQNGDERQIVINA